MGMIARCSPLALLLVACHAAASAAPPASLVFTHYDWELVCDNTRTCRAAGYHSEGGSSTEEGGEPLPVSVLFTRAAGPQAPIRAELQLGNPGEDQTVEEWPATLALTMRIDGKPAGQITVRQGKWTVPLAPQQAALLVAALTRHSTIAWSDGQRTWRLSDKGAAAVLLKMDEFQGRLDTPGALVRKGSREESGVLPPLAPPVVLAATVPLDDRVRMPAAALAGLRAALRPSARECNPPEADASRGELDVRRLSPTRLLVSMPCWRGAYNEGAAYWVVNARAPHAPRLVTHDANEYAAGKLQASHKGRGIGDCWGSEEWIWDGARFVHTASGTTGECRSIAPGGAWSLPRLVTTVRPAPGSTP